MRPGSTEAARSHEQGAPDATAVDAGAFHLWRRRCGRPEQAIVLPDGCRDVLLISRAGERPHVVQTELDIRPRMAALARDVQIAGYRLRPGAAVSDPVLEAVAAAPDTTGDLLRAALSRPGEIEAVIEYLAAPGAAVPAAARSAGISVRTLQREFRRRRLPPPEFWRLLARARRAARQLRSGAPLADIAGACGFSDQAHMTRALTGWFGAPPARLRRDGALLSLIDQPALGDWTAEQISTR